MKKTVKIISYGIKAVIPTGAYANIQPEIIVSADSIADAEAFVVPAIDALIDKYLNASKRSKVTFTATQYAEPATTNEGSADTVSDPEKSVSYNKALLAINSCLTIPSFEVISAQVEKSVRLNDEEKAELAPILEKKFAELSANN